MELYYGPKTGPTSAKKLYDRMRGLRFNGAAPNIAVVAMCASKLEHVGETLLLKHPRSGVGERLLELSDECMDWIREQSRSQWQHKRGFRAQNPLLAV